MINFPASLTENHLRVILKYFAQTNKLSPQEWRLAFAAFDILGTATVTIGRSNVRFRQFYDRVIDRPFAQEFIERLLTLTDLKKADGLQQQVAFEILAKLEQEGLYQEEVNGSEYLAAYCLY